MPERMLIVEDHPIYAEALQLAIENGMPAARPVHAHTLGEAKDCLAREKPFDLVLLDLWLPDTHGFEGLIELRKLFPRLPIIIVSAFADQTVVHTAMVCGAAGFIAKSQRKEALIQAIKDVIAGDVVLPPGCIFAGSVADAELATLTHKLKSLTPQQLRVLQMMCQGLLNKQIAYELDVGESTVKAHVSEIFRKLCVCSRTQAVLEVSKLDFRAVLALYAGQDAEVSVPLANGKHNRFPDCEQSHVPAGK